MQTGHLTGALPNWYRPEVKGVTGLHSTRLSRFAQFQLIQLQQITELYTRERYALDSDISCLPDLLIYTASHADESVRGAYQRVIQSFGLHDIEILKADFSHSVDGCR